MQSARHVENLPVASLNLLNVAVTVLKAVACKKANWQCTELCSCNCITSFKFGQNIFAFLIFAI